MSLGPIEPVGQVGPPGTSDMIIGDPVVGGTDGSILFVGSGNLAQDNANLFWDNTNNFLGIGTNTPTVELHVMGDSIIDGKLTVTGLIDPTGLLLDAGGANDAYINFKDGHSQSLSAVNEGKLIYNKITQRFEVSENNGAYTSIGGAAIGDLIIGAIEGSVLFVGPLGVLAQDNTNFFFDDATNSLLVKGHGGFGADSATVNNVILDTAETFTVDGSGFVEGIICQMQLDPSGPNTYEALAGDFEVITIGAEDFTKIVGIYANSNHASTGQLVGSLVGLESEVFLDTGCGNAALAIGGSFFVENNSTATLTDSQAVLIKSTVNSGGGTTTNVYGLFIEDQSGIGGTISYNLFSEGATSENVFEGQMKVDGHSAFGPDAEINGVPIDPQYNGLGYTFQTIQTLEEEYTDFSSIWLTGQVISIGCNPSAPPVGFAYTQVLDVFTDPANAEDFVVIDGLYVSPAHFGSGEITGALTGIQVQNLVDVAAGDVAALYDYVSLSENDGTIEDHACFFLQFINTGTITNNYGTLISTPVDSGSIDNNYGVYIEDQSGIGSTDSSNLVSLGANSLNYFQGNVKVDGIYLGSSSTAAASNDYAFTANQMLVSGNTTINAIVTPAIITAGTSLTLIFSGTPTVKHNTAGGAGTAKIFLAGGVDLTAAANFVLGLIYDGTQWQETFRKSPT